MSKPAKTSMPRLTQRQLPLGAGVVGQSAAITGSGSGSGCRRGSAAQVGGVGARRCRGRGGSTGAGGAGGGGGGGRRGAPRHPVSCGWGGGGPPRAGGGGRGR